MDLRCGRGWSSLPNKKEPSNGSGHGRDRTLTLLTFFRLLTTHGKDSPSKMTNCGRSDQYLFELEVKSKFRTRSLDAAKRGGSLGVSDPEMALRKGLSYPPALDGVKCLGTPPESSIQPPSSYITFVCPSQRFLCLQRGILQMRHPKKVRGAWFLPLFAIKQLGCSSSKDFFLTVSWGFGSYSTWSTSLDTLLRPIIAWKPRIEAI